MKLLITGVPGTGKSTIGEHLAKNNDFFHLDMEKNGFAPVRELKKKETKFLKKLEPHKNVVITWGFGFFSRPLVENLRKNGFVLFWLDGDRVASFKTFMQRDKHDTRSEYEYYSQLMGIIASDIVERLKPIVINPFTKSSELRPTAQVAEKIINHTKGDKRP